MPAAPPCARVADKPQPVPSARFRDAQDVYDFIVDAFKVHPLGAPGVGMSVNSTTTFYRLFGDTDAATTPAGGALGGDFQAVVNSGDNLPFRSSFNNPANYRAFLDFDGDGSINSGDNLQFRSRFNKALTWRV